MKRLIFLVGCVFVAGVCARQLDEPCNTPNNEAGIGKYFKECPELFDLEKTQENAILTRNSFLERTSDNRVVVCCPITHQETRCQSQREEALGSCIPLSECKQLNAMFMKRPMCLKTRQFLSNSQCGYSEADKQPLVCCSDEDKDNAEFVDSCEGQTTARPTTTTTTTESPEIRDEKTEHILRLIREKSKLIPTAPDCGTDLSVRIFGGKEAEIDEFNWVVLLQYSKPRDPPGFHCGGSLISVKYVLTAAHCVHITDSTWNLFSVRVGEHDLDKTKDCSATDETKCLPPVQDIGIAEKNIHPEYIKENKDSHHDIALLRLKKRVKLNDYVKPICLPLAQHLWNKDYSSTKNNKFTAAGWGKTEHSDRSSKKLLVKLPYYDFENCKSRYSSQKRLVEEQMCAGGEIGKDTCAGDSGGSLMIKDLEDDLGPYYVAGIVSFGPADCGKQNIPGVYTKVADYLEWILDTMYN